MINFTNLEYLKSGNERQQNAYRALSELQVMDKLHMYHPILAGTIPIGIDISSSDLDIICECQDHELFTQEITKLFGNQEAFEARTTFLNTLQSTIITFQIKGFQIELFAQDVPTQHQLAYKHMIIEYQILMKMGDEFRNNIIQLKQSGLKTEPAFAHLLELRGDPYKELLKVDVTML